MAAFWMVVYDDRALMTNTVQYSLDLTMTYRNTVTWMRMCGYECECIIYIHIRWKTRMRRRETKLIKCKYKVSHLKVIVSLNIDYTDVIT